MKGGNIKKAAVLSGKWLSNPFMETVELLILSIHGNGITPDTDHL
jgi:hypothetical protein